MKDNSSELSILVDRSVGASSIADGQLELMLHRFVLDTHSTHSIVIPISLIVTNMLNGILL